jgi:hypothetical protein
VVGVAACVAAALVLHHRGESSLSSAPAAEETATLAALGASAPQAPSGAGSCTLTACATAPSGATATTGAASGAAEDSAPARLEAPRLEAIRAEVARDPHGTPASLTNFAARIGDRMEPALAAADAGPARALFAELRECALGGDSPDSVRAICVRNAERLAGAKPELASQFKDLLSDAPAGTRSLILAMHRFGG